MNNSASGPCTATVGQQRHDFVLGIIGRWYDGVDDQIRVEQFDHVAFVAGEGPRPRLAPMAHLRIAQRGQSVGRDAAANAALACGRVRLQILRQDPTQAGERGVHGRRLREGHLGRDPLF